MNHFFDEEEAKKIGLDNAVVLYQMRTSGKALMTMYDLIQMFPYFTENQLRCRLRILRDKELVDLVYMSSGSGKQWFYRVENHRDLDL